MEDLAQSWTQENTKPQQLISAELLLSLLGASRRCPAKEPEGSGGSPPSGSDPPRTHASRAARAGRHFSAPSGLGRGRRSPGNGTRSSFWARSSVRWARTARSAGCQIAAGVGRGAAFTAIEGRGGSLPGRVCGVGVFAHLGLGRARAWSRPAPRPFGRARWQPRRHEASGKSPPLP